MTDLADGKSCEMKGSGAKPYTLKNVGGVYSCSCPAWRNQSVAIESRTCKHLRKLRGDAAEKDRIGTVLPSKSKSAKKENAPPILLAESWDNATDLTDWWISEKLDGVRAYWTGTEFLSRQGNRYHAPDWFTVGLPNVALDGELWMDRRAFQKTVSIVRRQDQSDHWKSIRYVVFDAPAQTDPFEERLAYLHDAIADRKHEYASVLKQDRCQGETHLRKVLAEIESLGGEGLMLREPASQYAIGRSSTLLKVKTFHDAEAIVIDHTKGRGKHKGRLGALVVQLSDGTEFNVGTGFSDAQRNDPPPVGAEITFRYQEMTDGGVPRFPSFVRAGLSKKKSTTAKAKSPAKGATQTAMQYFEFSDGKSDKFWEIKIDGSEVAVRYGRIGTSGQSRTKSFADAEAAQKYHEKSIRDKTDKGYQKVST
ncbi:MAG: DNA ligase [Pirellulaceae bacterium]